MHRTTLHLRKTPKNDTFIGIRVKHFTVEFHKKYDGIYAYMEKELRIYVYIKEPNSTAVIIFQIAITT